MANAPGDRGLLRRYADEGPPDTAVADEFAEHEIRRIGGDRETDALRAEDHGRFDADDLAARGDERAAGIARIERGVGLDHVIDQPARARPQRASERGDHAGGHRRLKAERIANRDDELAALEALGIAEPGRGECHGIFDAHEREVGIGVVADHARGERAPVDGRDVEARGAADHVAVGEDEAVGRHDDARAGAAWAALVAGLDVEAHHRRTDAVDHVDNGARIGIEQRLIFRWNRGCGGEIGCGFVEHGILSRLIACKRSMLALDRIGVCSQIWGANQRRGRAGPPFTSARPSSAGTILPLYCRQSIMTLRPNLTPFFPRGPLRKAPAAAVVMALASVLASCGEGPKQAAPPPPKVTVAEPIKRTIVDQDEYVGRFVAVDFVEVRARVSGYLDKIHFQDGQTVKQGDLLFTIDKRPFQNTLDQARANLELAKSNLIFTQADVKRGEQLLRDRTISEQIFEQRSQAFRNAQAAVAANEALVRQAELDLEFTELRAPVAGRIGDRRVTPGNLIAGGTTGTANTLLGTIVSIDPIRLEFTFDEASLLRYERLAREGQDVTGRGNTEVRLKLIDEPNFSHRGRM